MRPAALLAALLVSAPAFANHVPYEGGQRYYCQAVYTVNGQDLWYGGCSDWVSIYYPTVGDDAMQQAAQAARTKCAAANGGNVTCEVGLCYVQTAHFTDASDCPAD